MSSVQLPYTQQPLDFISPQLPPRPPGYHPLLDFLPVTDIGKLARIAAGSGVTVLSVTGSSLLLNRAAKDGDMDLLEWSVCAAVGLVLLVMVPIATVYTVREIVSG